MALSQKALQKKRAKKSEKRKETKKAGSGLLATFGFAREWAAAARSPVADVFVPTNIFTTGIGTVWFSRNLPDGRYAVAGFLVDTFCLGVKNALSKIQQPEEYAETLRRIQSFSEEPVEREHPAYARKLVERALAYAQDLGFDPHPDYKMVRMIFGDVDASACPASFTFGREGKPCYFCGPNDSPTMQRRILKQLEKRCGPGGYDFIVGLDSME